MVEFALRVSHYPRQIIFTFYPLGKLLPSGVSFFSFNEETDMSTSLSHSMYSLSLSEEKLVTRALRCLEKRLRYNSETLNSSSYVSSYLRLNLADEKNEVFAVLFLDSHHRLLAFEKLFYGTINESVVYPRVVVQKALEYNAAKVIFAHNHPSGNCTPSNSDEEMTRELKRILSIVSIIVVDHVIVTRENSYSFAEHGLM
jgi:DNA repair protein RadC